MIDDLGSIPEDYVADPNGSSLLFSFPNLGVLIAVHCKEGRATDEPGSGQLMVEGCSGNGHEDKNNRYKDIEIIKIMITSS